MANQYILVFAFLIFCGCATLDRANYYMKPDVKSRMSYLTDHPEVKEEIKTAIQEGRIVRGMTKEQAFVAYGETCSSYYDGNEVLIYAYDGGHSFRKNDVCYGEEKFYLRDGIVAFVSRSEYYKWKEKEFADNEKRKKESEKSSAYRKRKEYVEKNNSLTDVVKKAILAEKVVIGMTKEDVEASWGKPKDINRTVGSWGVHEQWVYGSSNYLYFEDGKLTSWQD